MTTMVLLRSRRVPVHDRRDQGKESYRMPGRIHQEVLLHLKGEEFDFGDTSWTHFNHIFNSGCGWYWTSRAPSVVSCSLANKFLRQGTEAKRTR
jgi:hypothetical protein